MSIWDEVKKEKKQLDEELQAEVRVALVGKGGAGKSSLVNGLAGRDICDVGVETDVTVDAEPVRHEGLVFVDMPGYGTKRFAPDSFAEKFSVDDYDLFLLVANDKFQEPDEQFFKKYLKHAKPAILVRTHVDTLKQRGKTNQELRDNIRTDVHERFGSATPLYFVDSVDGEGIAELNLNLRKLLPEAKRARWTQCAAATSEEMLNAKRALAERVVWRYSAAAAANGLNPIPGTDVALDFKIFLEMSKKIRTIYGLDDAALKHYEELAGTVAQIAGRAAAMIGKDALLALLKRYAGRQAAKSATKWIPVVGQAVASFVGFLTAKLAGDHLVGECHKIAADILSEQFKHCADGPSSRAFPLPGSTARPEMPNPQDLLTERLASLDDNDLKSLAGGLRLQEAAVCDLSHPELVNLCDKKLRAAGGFTSVNIVRRMREKNLPYKRLLIDVADKLSPGVTPRGWTPYRLGDDHSEEEIEDYILKCFEDRAREWWEKLPVSKRAKFVDGFNSVLRGAQEGVPAVIKQELQQQVVENLIQSGLISGLSKVSAGGLLGVAGVSVIGKIGWLILVHTVGWMAGLKIAVFGVGGYGAMGGAVSFLGATAVGTTVTLPGFLYLVDAPAYRKTIPTVVMLLAKTKLNDRE